MPMTTQLKWNLMKIITSFRILVLSGLICFALLAFYVTLHPAKAQEKHIPNDQHKLRTFSLANHANFDVILQQVSQGEMAKIDTNYFNSVKQVPVHVTTYRVNANATVLALPIMKHKGSSKSIYLDALNLSQTLRHVYVFNKQYPSSEGSRLPCVQTRTIPSFTICVFPAKEDIYISGSIQETGTWDTKQSALIQKALNTFPNAIFLDLGANIGYYSLLARAMGRTVIAVEPTEETFLRLQEGVVRNKFYDKIFMLKYAISDKRTRVVMGEDERNKGGIAIAREVNGLANISRSVEAITLDDLVNLIPAEEIIIKMDIEGYECKALQSSKQLLRNFKVRYIFMEWHILPQNQEKRDTPCPEERILHMLENMYNMGFKPYSVHGGELDINNSRSWKTNDIYWKPHDSPTL